MADGASSFVASQIKIAAARVAGEKRKTRLKSAVKVVGDAAGNALAKRSLARN